MLWLLAILLLCVNAEDVVLPAGVQHLKVSVVSPWAIFVSWKQPENVPAANISKYELTGGITQERNPGDDWVFCFVDTGLSPGSKVSVIMTVVYKNNSRSEPQRKNVTMPNASKSLFCSPFFLNANPKSRSSILKMNYNQFLAEKNLRLP